jgi:hypothetical protein
MLLSRYSYMTKKISPIVATLFVLFPAILFSQTGVFWFGDSASPLLNKKIISIKENPDGDLYLLGKATDTSYSDIHPYWAVCDKTGKLKSQTILPTTNQFYELNNFTICSADRIRIWGSEIVNKRLTMSLNTINPQGEIQGSDAMLTTTTTLTGDVCQLDKEYAVLAKTVQSSSTGKYHISIYKYNVANDQQTWYKTLATEENEEASKVFALKDGSLIVLGKMYNADLTAYSTLIYKLSATGEMIWKKNFDSYESFYAQGISEGKNKNLIYVCSTGKEALATGSTKIFMLDSNGNTNSQKEISDIRANGVLTLKNGNIFLYGAHYQKTGIYIISKATYKMFTPELKVVKEDEMGMFDGPDAYLPSLAMTAFPTASDFVTAIQLSDGRIACAGRVYMPAETNPDKIIFSDRYNKAFLVIMSADGKFRE